MLIIANHLCKSISVSEVSRPALGAGSGNESNKTIMVGAEGKLKKGLA